MRENKSVISAKKIKYLFAEIAKSITSSLDGSQIIDAIMKQIDSFYHPDNWSLLQVDPITKELYFIVAKGIDYDSIKQIRLQWGEGIAGYVAKTGKTLYIPNVEQDKRFSKKIDKLSGFKTESVIAVPIIYRNEVLGVIELVNMFNKRHFTKNEIEVLKIIADFSAIALTNAKAYEYVSYLSITDPLTGVYNRKYLNEIINTYNNLPPELEKRHVIVCWVDIDYFKQINDQYGHHKGDEVLKITANLLRLCCRKKDFVFRVGGDEFLIIITNLYENDVAQIKSQLHEQLKNYSSQIVPSSGFSFGIATGENKHLQKIIIEADNLMYKTKRMSHFEKYFFMDITS